MSKKLWKFDLYCGRMGSLEGVFVATEEEVTAAYGKRCKFGEVLGKHSDVSCDFSADQVKALTDDADFIAKAEGYGLVPTGFDPLQHIKCPECGEPQPAPYVACSGKYGCARKSENAASAGGSPASAGGSPAPPPRSWERASS